MHASIILLSALATSAIAAPTTPSLNVVESRNAEVISATSDYFNLLAKKVQEARLVSKAAPACDVSSAQLPTISGAQDALPAPTSGYKLKHVVLGRGTQNYTCTANDASAVPAAAGAVAALFDASCMATSYPDVLARLSGVTVNFDLSPDAQTLPPSNLVLTGHHYFAPSLSVPFFDLGDAGHAGCSKLAAQAAPADAAKGQTGEAAVPWLKLATRDGATGGLKEVYRVNTAGGSAPATCKGMPAHFEVQYAAQYWFYTG